VPCSPDQRTFDFPVIVEPCSYRSGREKSGSHRQLTPPRPI
jgi:hypothetical protein